MFKSILTLAVFAVSAFAQASYIGYPASSELLATGSLTVQVVTPMSQGIVDQVAVVIGMTACTDGCTPPCDFLGDVLYNGVYSPVLYPGAWSPYENFTVDIPSTASGIYQLNVINFSLGGAGLNPVTECFNQTVFFP